MRQSVHWDDDEGGNVSRAYSMASNPGMMYSGDQRILADSEEERVLQLTIHVV